MADASTTSPYTCGHIYECATQTLVSFTAWDAFVFISLKFYDIPYSYLYFSCIDGFHTQNSFSWFSLVFCVP